MPVAQSVRGPAALYRDGRKAETLSGSLMRFAASKGERVVVLAANARLDDARRAAPEG
jgi:hypothetical protein